MPLLPAATASGEFWVNAVYCTEVARSTGGLVTHFCVRRHDGMPVHDWRDIQRIKNQLAGDETDAYELYPPESNLVDMGNTTWIWCYPPGRRAPWRLTGGRTVMQPGTIPGQKQRDGTTSSVVMENTAAPGESRGRPWAHETEEEPQ